MMRLSCLKNMGCESGMAKWELVVAYVVTGLLLFQLLYRIFNTLTGAYNSFDIYSGYFVSEYMINYQGGFVRRGLIGEILYQIFLIHPYAVHEAVFVMDSIFAICLVIISSVVFIRMGWFPILVLAINYGVFYYRRDFLMLSIAFFVFDFMFRYAKNKRIWSLICSMLLMCLSILIYEPSFFFMVPLSAIILYSTLDGPVVKKVFTTVLSFAVPIILMAIVCLSKGSQDIANDIWTSWNPLFDYIGKDYKPDSIPAAVDFLGRETIDVFKFHLDLNFHIYQDDCYKYVLGAILMFAACFFLTVFTPSRIGNDVENRSVLSYVFIFQLCCLLPMFTVLSCDFGRTIYYVVFSSCFISYFVMKYGVDIHKFPCMGLFIYEDCRISPIGNNLIVYLIVLLLMPFNSCCGVSIEHPLLLEYSSIFIRLYNGLW